MSKTVSEVESRTTSALAGNESVIAGGGGELRTGASTSAVSDHDTGRPVGAAEEMSPSRCHNLAFTGDKQYV